MIEDELKKSNYQITNAKKLYGKLFAGELKHLISLSGFYELLKVKGYKYRQIIRRSYECLNVKEYRIWYYYYWLDVLENKDYFCLYFDWSSFSESNFQRKIWSQKVSKAIITEQYHYQSLHLLTLMSNFKMEALQFVQGSLSSFIIFRFLKTVLLELEHQMVSQNKTLVVILDNSPMNHSVSLKNFSYSRRIHLLYTSPNSSFQNPIEMAYTKIKKSLKRVFSSSKSIKKNRYYKQSN